MRKETKDRWKAFGRAAKKELWDDIAKPALVGLIVVVVGGILTAIFAKGGGEGGSGGGDSGGLGDFD